MMASLEDRVAKLEERMDLFSQRTTLAHDTASDALHVAHLNAGLLSALRETQVEHGIAISQIKRDVSELHAGQGTIVGLIEELIRRDDERRTDPSGVGE